MREEADSALQHYIQETFVQESVLLEEVRQVGEALVPGMQISPNEGKLLQVLTTMVQARHVLEIGTFVGYSTLWMASALPEDGTVTTLEGNPQNAALAKEHFSRSGIGKRVHVLEGKALASLASLQERKEFFDVVFIDAAKSEYAEYLQLTEPLLRPGGLMIGDNSLLFGHMIDAPKKEVNADAIAAMRQFNRHLGDEKRYQSILLPTEEGLTIAVKLS